MLQAPSSAREGAPNVLLFGAGGRSYALPLAAVSECMRPLPLTPVAGLPAWVLGVATIRGEAVPVVDPARLLGGETAVPTRFVTLRSGDRPVALAVTAVEGVACVALAGLPPLLAGAGEATLADLVVRDGGLLAVLEAARLLPPEGAS